MHLFVLSRNQLTRSRLAQAWGWMHRHGDGCTGMEMDTQAWGWMHRHGDGCTGMGMDTDYQHVYNNTRPMFPWIQSA